MLLQSVLEMSFEDQYQSASSSGRFSARVGIEASPGGGGSSSTIRANIARMGDNIQRMARMVCLESPSVSNPFRPLKSCVVSLLSGSSARNPEGHTGAAEPIVRYFFKRTRRYSVLWQTVVLTTVGDFARRRSMRKETTNLTRQTKDSIQLLGTSDYQNVSS